MAQAQAPAENNKRNAILREMLDWIKTFAIAFACVFLLTTFIFQIIFVDGTSMQNTLMDGERMLVTKYNYLFGDPQRFDVVICHYPGRGQVNFVKRVVGIPGDTVAIRGGVLYVNGEPVDEEYIDYPPGYDMAEQVVQEGRYFVMGDNRAGSNDSRNTAVGQLERKQIIGKVRAVIWPLSQWRGIR